ncbi:MAG: hypothetical protein ACK5JH_14530 [Anaerocolumna sp.]
MDEQEELISYSRAEYIRLARESCANNLDSHHMGRNTNKVSLPEVNGLPNFRVKSLLIRVICCALIFLFVFIIDKFDISLKNVSVGTIQEWISSNKGIEEAQNFIVQMYEKVLKK